MCVYERAQPLKQAHTAAHLAKLLAFNITPKLPMHARTHARSSLSPR